MKRSLGEKTFNVFNIIFLGICALIMIYPFYFVVIRSVMPYQGLVQSKLTLWPKSFTFESYKTILGYKYITSGFLVTVMLVVCGVPLTLAGNLMFAYGLTKRALPGRAFINAFITIPMFVGGGLIPGYLLIKNLGLIDSWLSIILPAFMSTYYLVVSRSFFESIPTELEESAMLDGASYLTIFIRIVIPLSLPIITTIALFSAVNRWNGWYNAMLYLNDKNKWPLALVLRDILINNNTSDMATDNRDSMFMMEENLKMATVVVSIVPILIIYPFIQKYFTKGMMLGAVKS